MIGNDIVDLLDRDADASTYRPGFDARVFTRGERRTIEEAAEPERQRWRLWSAKEAAYKAARRCDPTTVFSPSAFVVELFNAPGQDLEKLRGVVDHLGTRYRVVIGESHRWVHAIATRGAQEIGRVITAVSRNDEPDRRRESFAVRRLARECIARHLDVSTRDLQICREGRVPGFWLRGRRLNLSLSLSHSGGVVAFACCEGESGIG